MNAPIANLDAQRRLSEAPCSACGSELTFQPRSAWSIFDNIKCYCPACKIIRCGCRFGKTENTPNDKVSYGA